MFKSTLVILPIVFVALAKAQIFFPTEKTEDQISYFGECYNPNHQVGLCIYISQCSNLMKLYQKNPLHDSERQFLKSSQCGYTNKQVLVCCLRKDIQVPTATIESNSGAVQLPDPPVCGGGHQDRIYGGNKTKIDEFPWMALLEYSKPGNRKGFHCGGSLINSRYVITAAHCVGGKAIPSDWVLSSVRLGEWDTATDRDCSKDDCADPHVDVPIEKIIPHPNYDSYSKAQYHDIALLRLSRDVSYTDFIKPVCLPRANHLKNSNWEGVSLDVSGWGKTENKSNSNVKLKAAISGVNLQQCNQIYSKYRITLQDSQLCAGGEQNVDSCRGDSGGPLVFQDQGKLSHYVLVGIVSFGPNPCGLEGWPGVYTKTSAYLDWIQQTMEP